MELSSKVSKPKIIDEATTRLTEALRTFEAAVAQNLDKEKQVEGLEEHIRALSAEQERLAASLNVARQRAERLETTNDEVSHRLENVIDSIKTIVKAG
jgi:predicted nuclease with TOPRIM domain